GAVALPHLVPDDDRADGLRHARLGPNPSAPALCDLAPRTGAPAPVPPLHPRRHGAPLLAPAAAHRRRLVPHALRAGGGGGDTGGHGGGLRPGAAARPRPARGDPRAVPLRRVRLDVAVPPRPRTLVRWCVFAMTRAAVLHPKTAETE